MNKKPVFFDTVCILAIFSMLFSIGFHIGKDKKHNERHTFVISIDSEKISGSPDEISEVKIDGKYPCKFISISNNTMTLSSFGLVLDAGYLLCGAKYISKNQPIVATADWGFFEGRIVDIKACK